MGTPDYRPPGTRVERARLRPLAGTALALLPCLALLSACAVGPSYHRPDTSTPAAYRGQARPGERSVADLGWWDLYHDPALDSLVRQALAGGFDARIAATRVEQARAGAMLARSALFPLVGYGGDASRGKNSVFGSAFPESGVVGNDYDAFLSAAWEPDIWGRLRRMDEAARDQYLQSQAARQGVLLSLVTDVASDYFGLLELDEEMAVTREAAKGFGESYQLFQERLRGGVASKLETASALAAQAAEDARIPLLERQIATAENSLCLLLGKAPGPIVRPTSLYDHIAPPEVPAGLPAQLLERRPDVLAAEDAAKAATAQVGATIGSFLPNISLSALFGGVSPQLGSITSSNARLWSLSGQVTGPIFRAGGLKAEYIQVRAAWNEAMLEYQQTALAAFADVADALVARQKLQQALAQQEREVGAYREAVQVATERYKAGQSGYYELLQAQEQLYPAEIALAQTRRDELISLVQLYKALGGGWNLKDPAAWAGPTR